ncbi:MAG TPA: hypothetical protein VHT92_06915 [Candidatus Cybelea sp.]|jgi:hypothetical protein|nr:hypothetical protein [Candidatus Cybelea sp.]
MLKLQKWWRQNNRTLFAGIAFLIATVAVVIFVDGGRCQGDCRPALVVATGFTALQQSQLELEFHYVEPGQIEVKSSGPRTYSFVLSDVRRDSNNSPACRSDKNYLVYGKPLTVGDWIQLNPEYVGHIVPTKLYEFDVDSERLNGGSLFCDLDVQATFLSREDRGIEFLHSLRRDSTWYAHNVTSDTDKFVLDDPDAVNGRVDDDYGLSIEKTNARAKLFTQANSTQLLPDVTNIETPENAYTRFEWTDGNAVSQHELYFFIAGIFAAISTSCLLSIVMPKAS